MKCILASYELLELLNLETLKVIKTDLTEQMEMFETGYVDEEDLQRVRNFLEALTDRITEVEQF
jgi:hypothetical protein